MRSIVCNLAGENGCARELRSSAVYSFDVGFFVSASGPLITFPINGIIAVGVI